MVISCEHVWREISNYLEDDIDPTLKAAMEEHIHGCNKCTAVLEGTRNIIGLYGDERLLQAPLGYSQRLHRKLEENMPGQRGGAFGWVLALAALLLIAGSVKLGRSSVFYHPDTRSVHADPANIDIPPEMLVVVSDGAKTFHRKTCPFIHDKAHERTITAAEAVREGYAPCVRCMRQYMAAASPLPWMEHDEDEQARADAEDVP